MTGISVIIPTYNRESFLEHALESVYGQTRPCDEIIVIDDGSIDHTKDCVKMYSDRLSIPVRYHYQKNKGPAAARNRGVAMAEFSHLAFLDSDDHWQKNKLELQYAAFMKEPKMMISHTKERWFRRGIHLNQKKNHQPMNGDIFKQCLKLCAVGMSTVMVKKELFTHIGLFNETMRCCEDYDFWLRVSSRYQFMLLNKPLTIKEGGREDQVSYQYRVGMDKLRIGAILNILKEQVLSIAQTKWALEELHKKCMVYGRGCVKHRRPKEGKKYIQVAEWAKLNLVNEDFFSLSVPDDPLTMVL